MKKAAFLALAAPLWVCAAQAAEPVPAPVEAMIRAADGAGDLDAVAAAAKSALPGSAAEIDALVTSLKDARERERIAAMAQAGIFDNWSGEGEAGFSRTTGNTHDVGIAVGLQLLRDGLEFRHKVNGFVDWQRSSGVVTRNRYTANYEINYKFNERLYMYGLAGWDRNTFAGYTSRFSESFGAGYSILTGDTMRLDVTAGPSFQQTRNVDGTRDDTQSARASLDFAWRIFDGLNFGQRVSVYFGNQLTSTTFLTSQIRGGLAARLSFDLVRENDPPAGSEKVDTATRLSLVYGF